MVKRVLYCCNKIERQKNVFGTKLEIIAHDCKITPVPLRTRASHKLGKVDYDKTKTMKVVTFESDN